MLQKKGGLAGDPFTASLAFSTRKQKKDEQAEDFTSDLAKLTKLFKQLAYPKEHLSSSVLLQQFVTGLCSPISHQILFRVRPCDLDFQAATESASEVEQAFSLHPIKEDRFDLVTAVEDKRLFKLPPYQPTLKCWCYTNL